MRLTSIRYNRWLALMGVLFALGVTDAWAFDTNGIFVGVNASRVISGYSRATLDGEVSTAFGGESSGFVMGPSSSDQKHAVGSIDLGYMFTENWGLEVSYIDLGHQRYASFASEPAADGATSAITANIDLRSHGPAVSAIGVLPMTELWEVDARVGGYEGKTVTTFDSSVDGEHSPGQETKSTTSLLLGAGTGLTLTNHFTLRVEYVHLQGLKESLFSRSYNVDLVSAGVRFYF